MFLLEELALVFKLQESLPVIHNAQKSLTILPRRLSLKLDLLFQKLFSAFFFNDFFKFSANDTFEKRKHR